MKNHFSRRDTLRLLGGAGMLAALGGVGLRASAANKISDTSVLIVVDVQNCFIPGGTLPVTKGEEVVPIINTISKKFKNVVITQDWHTKDHISFASSHPGKKPFETTKLPYADGQTVWPDHCVQGTKDAELHKDLSIPHAQLIIRKGIHAHTDGYSAFVEADRKTNTGLTAYLRERKLSTVYVTGLATDFCVLWTALDARSAGFKVLVIEDACRGIDLNGSVDKAWASMKAKGIMRVQSSDLA